MYDIYDDELNEMYESKGNNGITLDKGITPNDPLSTFSLCLIPKGGMWEVDNIIKKVIPQMIYDILDGNYPYCG